MSNYTKQISWSGKDALSDSDSEKVISGGDFDTEFSAVQTAINSKIDGGTITNFTSTGIDDNATSTAITIDASENVEINTGNLIIGTSGKGIDFSADGNAAGMTSEVLDDYEEGTFTAVVTMGSGTAPMDTNFDRLVYTKIGRQVHISGQFRFGTVSSPSGSFSLSLPFAAAEQEEYAEIGTGTFRAYQVTIPATAVSPATTFSPGGGSSMQFQWSVNNSVATNAIATSNGYYSIGVTYYT